MNKVSVRWHDGYLEEFEATEVRFGSDLLWLRLSDGKNRHIPLRSVRWFGMSQESHQSGGDRNKPVYPELTAEWIPHLPNEEGYATHFQCSHCNTWREMGVPNKTHDFDYCPTCGAYMRGKRNG